MIGKSGSGKTSFMSGLHDVLMLKSIDGFCIKPSAEDFKTSIRTLGKFSKISIQNRGFIFPDGTQHTTLWNFDFLHNHNKVCEFGWIDYRGGILDDIYSGSITGNEENEIDELIGHIALSNAVIIFADSILLSLYDNTEERRYHTGANIIFNILGNYFSHCNNRNLNIILLLTKTDSDLISDDFIAEDYKKLIAIGVETFGETINLCNNNSKNWKCAVLPIGVIGRENLKTIVENPDSFRQSYTICADITGIPKPFNLEYVIFYCICETLEQIKKYQSGEINNLKDEAEHYLSKSNFLKEFWALITNQNSPKKIAQSLFDKLEEEKKSVRLIEKPISDLKTITYKKVKEI